MTAELEPEDIDEILEDVARGEWIDSEQALMRAWVENPDAIAKIAGEVMDRIGMKDLWASQYLARPDFSDDSFRTRLGFSYGLSVAKPSSLLSLTNV